MDVYKLHTGSSEIKKINRTVFETDTLKKSPYYKQNDNGSISQFAVCPACDNPIQIIGLYTKSQKSPKPYGRHYPRSIHKLADYNQENYEHCPYASPTPYNKTSRRSAGSKLPRGILSLLKEHFDDVLGIISSDTGIIITENLAKSMLNSYLGEQGYRYTGATLMNIPWIFAYMSDAQSLYGRIIDQNSTLAAVLRNDVDGITLNERGQIVKTGNEFLSINFCFVAHTAKLVDNVLDERMDFVVSLEKNGMNHIVYRQEIVFEHKQFQTVMYSSADKSRRTHFLKLAAEMIHI